MQRLFIQLKNFKIFLEIVPSAAILLFNGRLPKNGAFSNYLMVISFPEGLRSHLVSVPQYEFCSDGPEILWITPCISPPKEFACLLGSSDVNLRSFNQWLITVKVKLNIDPSVVGLFDLKAAM